MKNIYLVIQGQYHENGWVEAAFLEREKAERYIANLEKNNPHDNWWVIKDFTVEDA